ncbi:MAG TPA: CorA family divalent cation transporter [Allosphingosinicella sp.]|nr:CorA family divalent cation transporter [Allosphingosinicella sp.]
MGCTAILAGDGPVRSVTAEEAAAYAGPGFVWLHIEGGSESDLALIKGVNGVPEVAAYALVATETRPRCDVIEDGALINLRGPGEVETDDSDRLVSIRMWARQGRVHSVTRRPLAATRAVTAQMEAGQIHDPGDLVAAFARAISKQLDPQVAALGDELDDCETGLEPSNVYRFRSRIARIRSEAIAFRRFVSPDRDALNTLAHLPFEWLAEEDRVHIREAADRFARMTEELEAVRERAALLHEQLTDLRGETIETRALLISIVALIFLPLTFITGLWGMNVPVPGTEDENAFAIIVSACIAVALLIGAYFARIHWLRR